MMTWGAIIQAGLLGYFLGALPFGYWLLLIFDSRDVRKLGSGNIGATNVLRSGSKILAALTLLLDVGKGFAAVFLASYFWPSMPGFTGSLEAEWLSVIAGVCAVLGHVFPIFLKFKGGKGIATYFGVLLGLTPLAAYASLGVWCIGLFWSRRSSVASLVAVILSPVWVWFFQGGLPFWVAVGAALFLCWTHRSNLVRILRGVEQPLF